MNTIDAELFKITSQQFAAVDEIELLDCFEKWLRSGRGQTSVQPLLPKPVESEEQVRTLPRIIPVKAIRQNRSG